jgi:hypothetical protein
MYKHTIKAFALAVGLSMGGAAMAGPGHSAMNEEPAVWQAYGSTTPYHSRSDVRADYRAALRDCRALSRDARQQCFTDARMNRDAALAARHSTFAYANPVPQYMLPAPFEGPAIP